jgi:hypothetical protein
MRIAPALVLILAVPFARPVAAGAQGLGLGARAGTLGVGGEVAIGLTDRVVARGGVGWAPVDPSVVLGGIEVTFAVPRIFNAGIDLYLNGAMRVGGGVIFGSDDPALEAAFATDQDIGGTSYTPQEVGRLVGVLVTENLVPYALMGFGPHIAPGVGLFVDFGVAFLGRPSFRLAAEGGTLASDVDPLRSSLAAEAVEFQDDAGGYLRFWPLLSVGLRLGAG